MTRTDSSSGNTVWSAIDDEKRRDRFIRRVSIAAWSVTFLLILLLAVLVGISEAQMVKAVLAGALPWMTVLGVAMPLIIVLGIVSLLIATLSTVGVFLRMRTTTLSEIQLRLAALEQMLASRGDTQ
ncbi:MAG: hypothetical protein ACM3SX_16575 [Deltaproteobacteria bacterium]